MPVPLNDDIRGDAQAALAELSLEETVAMLSGHGFFEDFAETRRYCSTPYRIGGGNERLGLPQGRFTDGPRGVVTGRSTCFPVPMARGASFDPALEARIGDAIGRECRAQGANLFGGVCINLLRHPAWGRAQETYGEDPHHLGEMGAALVRGVQRHNVIATIKHFAANSMENARFEVDVQLDARTLHEVYLPHFKRCIDEGAGAVMSAYNQVNGAYCGHNAVLLRDILKARWGFTGFVYSDFVRGCYSAQAVAAGLDVEAPDTMHFGPKLLAAVDDGNVARDQIDEAARRVLETLWRFETAPDPEDYDPAVVACDAHVALAREAAEQSMVLLRNDGQLPWDPAAIRSIAVIGPYADRVNLGDRGSSNVEPPHALSFAEGLRRYGGERFEVLCDDGADLERAAKLAARADALVIAVGNSYRSEGEYIPGDIALDGGTVGADGAIGGDRDALTLDGAERALVARLCAVNERHLVAVMSGSAVLIDDAFEACRALMMTWYPGMQGGAALARLLFGAVNPSGKLPFVVPRRESDLPYFDKNAKTIEYGFDHGYVHLDRSATEPAYPFGFGLSYTAFEIGMPAITVNESDLQVSVAVTNVGARAGAEVLQLYVAPPGQALARERKRLKAFRKVFLAAGEQRVETFAIALDDLRYFDSSRDDWRLEPGTYALLVGNAASAEHLKSAEFTL
ncbi:MAG: glycoside hydrolase family 3 C-terminal domain-containing protein [Pseudomonadota bacterium]